MQCKAPTPAHHSHHTRTYPHSRARHVNAPLGGRGVPLHRLRVLRAGRLQEARVEEVQHPRPLPRCVLWACDWKEEAPNFTLILTPTPQSIHHLPTTHYAGAAIGIALAGTYPESVLRVVTVEALGLISKPAESAPATLRCVPSGSIDSLYPCIADLHTYDHHPITSPRQQ